MKFKAEEKIVAIEKEIADKKKELAEWRKMVTPKEVTNYTFRNWNNEEG